MEKNLPGVFRNPIDHPIKNNKEMGYVSKKEVVAEPVVTISKEERIKNDLYGGDIKRKINDIFRSVNYVYKADVEIKLKDKTIVKKIVGHNTKSLITIDNDLIDIDSIIDIKMAK